MTAPLPLELSAESLSFQRPSPERLHSVLFYGVFGLLMFGPLAFGAVESWSVLILQAVASVLFLLWAVAQFRTGELQLAGNPLFLPMSLFASVILVQLVAGRTAYFAATFSAVLLYCTYGVISFLVVQCLRKTHQVRILAWMFCGYGFAVAMFALLQGLSSNDKLYWLRTPKLGGWIYGPYVNHNHYAGLMEMLTPIPLVIACTSGVRRERRLLAGIVAAVMASTIFLSGSRGGMVAFTVEIGLLASWLLRRNKKKGGMLVFVAFLAVVVGLAAWLGGGELLDRVTSIHGATRVEMSGGTRLQIARDAAKMFVQKPVLGWGLGVFQEVYPQFRSFSTDYVVDQAHNDYVQILVETGILGFAAGMWFLVTVYRCALKKLRSVSSNIDTGVTLATGLGIAGILVHSFADFNLQIPANAALFYTLCVVAAMKPRFDTHRRLRHRRSHATDDLLEESASATRASIG